MKEIALADEHSPLIMDLVAHSKAQVSLAECDILNPDLSCETIQERLETLTAAGVLAKARVGELTEAGSPEVFYRLTEEARSVFNQHELFAPEPLREMFNRIDHSEAFVELRAQPRPSIE